MFFTFKNPQGPFQEREERLITADNAAPLNNLTLVRAKESEYGLPTYAVMVDGRSLESYLSLAGRYLDDLYLEDFRYIAGLDDNDPDVDWTKLHGRMPVLIDLFGKRITVQVDLFNDRVIWSDFKLGQADEESLNAPPLHFSKDEYLAFTRRISQHRQAVRLLARIEQIPDGGLDLNQLASELRSLPDQAGQMAAEELALDKLPAEWVWGRDGKILFLFFFCLACGLGTAAISIVFLNEGTTETFIAGLIGLTVALIMLIPPSAGLISYFSGYDPLMIARPEGLSIRRNNSPIPWEHIAGYELARSKSMFRSDVFVIRLKPGFKPTAFQGGRRIRLMPGEIRLTLDFSYLEPTVYKHIRNILRFNLAAAETPGNREKSAADMLRLSK